MSITNKIENIAIAVITAILAIALTVAIMELTSIRMLKKEIARQDLRMEKQDAVIVELARIEKYKIENKFDQLKAKDGQVIITLDNKLEAMQTDSLKYKPPEEKVKKSFWKKLRFW